MFSVSVVIPAYNEEYRIIPTLKEIVSYMREERIDYEILVIDDGSTDNTVEKINTLKLSNLKIISNESNSGKGFSFKRGFQSSKKQYVLLTDADLGVPISELKKFRAVLGTSDIIIGTRAKHESIFDKRRPLLRKIYSKCYNLLVKLFIVNLTDDALCGFKLYNRIKCGHIISMQRINGFGSDVELLFLAKKFNLSIKEVSVNWSFGNNSKIMLLIHPLMEFFNIWKIRVNELSGIYK